MVVRSDRASYRRGETGSNVRRGISLDAVAKRYQLRGDEYDDRKRLFVRKSEK